MPGLSHGGREGTRASDYTGTAQSTGEAFLIALAYVGALAVLTTIVGTRRFRKLVA